MMSPSWNRALGKGSVARTPGAAFSVDGTIEIGCGRPKRTVPRVTTSALSTRCSTGTRMGDGDGAAVRAAASAGASIRDPATHAPIAAPAAVARTKYRTPIGFMGLALLHLSREQLLLDLLFYGDDDLL